MAVVGVSITKEAEWRGAMQPFSNVYHYDIGDEINNADWSAMVAALVANEKTIFHTSVVFEQGRVWGDVLLGKELSETLALLDLSGNGTNTASNPGMYRESAYLVQWEMFRKDILGRKKYLRKWLHTMHTFGTSGAISGSVDIGATAKTQLDAYARAVQFLPLQPGGPDNAAALCAPQGEYPKGDPTIFPYLELRDLGDTWRG